MAKKKRKKAGSSRKRSKALKKSPRSYEEIVSSIISKDPEYLERIKLANKLDFLATTTLFLVFFYGVYQFTFNRDIVIRNFSVMPEWMQLLSIGILVFLLGLATYFRSKEIFLRIFLHWPVPEPDYVTQPKKYSALVSILFVAFAVTILLYLQGVVLLIANVIRESIFPQLSDAINYLLANIVSWVFAGVVGNLVYDILKRFLLYRRNTSTSER